jgi:hypothetical protein
MEIRRSVPPHQYTISWYRPLASVDKLRRDVEAAFVSKSFAAVARTYRSRSPVELKLEDEMDDEHPHKTFTFSSLSKLSAWFYEKHQYAPHMIIPTAVACSDFHCEYEMPELTMHHGTYLTGFKGKVVGKCTSLIQVSIYWG